MYGDQTEEKVAEILARVDANGSGEIDYSGKIDIYLYECRMGGCNN